MNGDPMRTGTLGPAQCATAMANRPDRRLRWRDTLLLAMPDKANAR